MESRNGQRRVGTLDRLLPDFDVNGVHGIPLDMPPESALDWQQRLSFDGGDGQIDPSSC
jgi:hypothetical protein